MQRLALVLAALLCFSSYSNAQVNCSTDGTTNPIVGNGTCLDPNNNTSQEIINQGDFGTGSHNTGSSHNQMYQMTDSTTGAVLSTDYILHFSYTDDTWITNMAINQALVGAGFDIAGYTAEWQWKNETTNTINGACTATKVNGDCLDDLVITIDAFASGVNIYSEEWDYSQTKSNGYTVEEILSFSPLALVPGLTIDEIEVTIRGKDNGYWQGMHGPKVKNFTGSVVLMPDTCTLNGALSDPTCPGYAAALFQQQCTANPLFDASCPGYAAAYLIQQCTANPLHDPSCTGYQQAYLNQQCKLDPLYDSSCTGYAAAYLADRCYYDPLYDVQCTGYQQAYFDQQCELDSQYDQLCPAYLDPDLVDLGDVDPVGEVLSEPDIPVVAELDFTSTVNDFDGEVVVEDQQIVETVEVEDGDGFQQVDDSIEGEQLQMEDDIEKEIAALENEAAEDDTAPDFVKGNSNQEDDIEKELAELKNSENSDNKKDAPKPKTKNEKIKLLLAMKAIELTKKLEKEVSLEQNMIMQRQLLALISYVPGFDYNEKKLPQTNFYPPKPTVDHAYARWFLNDPNFGLMEDSQYNFK
jgi:hypothetical protein